MFGIQCPEADHEADNNQGEAKFVKQKVGLAFDLLLAFGDGFFLACEDFGRLFEIQSPPAFFFFFFEVEISLRTLIPLFMPGSVHSGSVS